jgi:hypothetical protein
MGMIGAAGAVAAATIALAPATAAAAPAPQPPALDVTPLCRAVAQKTAPVDGYFRICMEREERAREELRAQWIQFDPRDRSHCLQLSRLGGLASYVDLLTCLELARDARNLRQRNAGTLGQGE